MTRDDAALAALNAIAGGQAAADLESSRLEFKQQKTGTEDAIRDLLEACLCFANAEGGVVVAGVADRPGGPSAFHGVTLDPERVQQRIYQLSRPGLVVEVRLEHSFPAPLIFIYVPRSPDIHSDTRGRAPRRFGTDCIPMDPGEQARLREERSGFDWSAVPTSRSWRDVSAAALTAARRRLAVFVDLRRELSNLSDQDLLRALGVVNQEGVLLRAGEVLLCEPKQTSPAIVYQYRLTPGGEPRAVERLDAPLLLAFERCLDLVTARRNVAPVSLPDGQQIELEDFPTVAVREAIANAVIHRDYHLSGPTHVEHSPNVLVVSSPGPLVSGVTPENILTHPSKPRNPALAQALRRLGLAEEVGRGVDRMVREMIRAGRDVPRIESHPDHVRVTFVGGAPNTQIARFVAQLPESEQDDTDTMLIILGLCSKATVNALVLAPIVQKTVEEAESVLRRLATDGIGILEPTRQSARRAHPYYRFRAEVLKSLGSAVRYHRRTVDDIDRKVIAHVHEYGKVTNRTLQNLLDVSLARARSMLADLVRREILVKTSAHERGPGVEYGPGPKFPEKKKRRARRTD
jgi:ATP-dependent DNA helicase RecG